MDMQRTPCALLIVTLPLLASLTGCLTIALDQAIWELEGERFRSITDLDYTACGVDTGGEEHRIQITAILDDGTHVEFVHVINWWQVAPEPSTWVLTPLDGRSELYGPGMRAHRLGSRGTFEAEVSLLSDLEYQTAAIITPELEHRDVDQDEAQWYGTARATERAMRHNKLRLIVELPTGQSPRSPGASLTDHFPGSFDAPGRMMGLSEVAAYALFPVTVALDAIYLAPLATLFCLDYLIVLASIPFEG